MIFISKKSGHACKELCLSQGKKSIGTGWKNVNKQSMNRHILLWKHKLQKESCLFLMNTSGTLMELMK